MGLPIENLYKTDPPEPYLNFQKIILKIIFFEQIDPKNPKNTTKNYKMSKNMVKEGSEIFFTVL